MKRFLSVAMVVSMLSLTACGGMSSAQSDAPAEEAAAPVETEAAAPVQADSEAEIVIKLSNGSSESAPTVVTATDVFKPMVEEATDGKVRIDVYASAQLGDDTKATEACRAGELEMVNTSTAPLVGLIPELAIFDIPFLFTSPEIADAVIDGPVGELINEKLEEKGLINLAWNENGFRDLTNSIRPVSSPEDLVGLKIRTMENQFHLEAWAAMGASPTPMSWSEVFTALQQHTIDGQENPIPNFYSARIHEVNQYITTTGHIYSPQFLLYSKELFDKLDPDVQQALRDAGEAYTIAEREENRRQSDELKVALVEEGCEVIELTAEQKQAFVDATASVWDSVGETVGEEMMTLLRSELEKASS
ncbi:DctP family TRAP transporter solute-binding subunit [Chakrabartyella piscis]|uniref:DctP family TRAP transporter solute-binding subunit n=1 Tax=Chakrabartyella piscis TaxID=2918914 RepID=UPI0029587A9E|nr:DctP family TRAP transporter solute-binding subunit [Chakrabartyella piscis]